MRGCVILSLTALLATPALADESLGLTFPLGCAGGEPFWGLTIKDAKNATYVWDNQPTAWTVKSVDRAAGRITTWRVTFAGKTRYAFIFDEGTHVCSDSDSDEPSAYGILLQDGDGFLRGCCNPKE